MNPVKQLLKHALGTLLPSRKYLLSGPRQSRDIAFTFDDGPDPEQTGALLDLLRDLEIRGTFFVQGNRAEESPRLIERIVAEGHAVGNHSWSHGEPHLTSAKELADEVERTRELLKRITGVTTNLFRPPKGKLSISKFRELWKLDQTIVLWNIDPRDYAVTVGETLDRWVEGYQPTAGDIVLFHDIHPHCRRAIRVLAERAEFRRDWRFVTIADWLDRNDQRATTANQEASIACR
jgi:peptidoglycan/xylan/chitin deacetylase (PgdA/CDA1 family)